MIDWSGGEMSHYTDIIISVTSVADERVVESASH